MRGPDRKGVRGFANMTDSHMVGGHPSSPDGARVLHQAGFLAGILLGVAALYVLAAFVWSEEPGLRAIAWAVIGLAVVVLSLFQVRRVRSRESLDDVLRSRRSKV